EAVKANLVGEHRLLERVPIREVLALLVPGPGDGDLVEDGELHQSRSFHADGHLLEPADEVRGPARRRFFTRELEVGYPPDDLLEHHAELEAREARAEAEVRAVPESEVLVRGALDVEVFAAVKDALVAVRRRIEKQQLVALADVLPVQRDV